MYTKQNLIDSVSKDFGIIKHLAEKVDATKLDYKQADKQRTTLELLQYMSVVFAVTAKAILTNDMTVYQNEMGKANDTTLENFGAMIDKQEAEFKALMADVKDEDFETIINMYGQGEKTKGVYLVDGLLKNMSAYKMQLFLYIKASGNTDIGTPNLWAGMDAPKS